MQNVPLNRKSVLLFRNPHSGLRENGVPFGRNMHHELAKMMCVDSRNINQIAKAANTYGWVDEKVIADMKTEHEKVLETVKEYFDKLLEIM